MWRSAALIGAILALGSWIVFCLVAQPPRIEETLRRETERAMSTAVLGDVRALVTGRNVAIEGLVGSAGQKAEAERLVASVPGIRSVDNRLNLLGSSEQSPAPIPSTYLEISTGPDGLGLRGGVPSEALRLEIVEQAQQLYNTDRVEELLTVDPGAEDGAALAGAAGVIRALAGAEVVGAEEAVRVRLQGDSLRMSGTVTGEQTRQRLEERMRAAVPGVRLFFSTLTLSDQRPGEHGEGGNDEGEG